MRKLQSNKFSGMRKSLSVAVSFSLVAGTFANTAQAEVDCKATAAAAVEVHPLPHEGYWMQSVDDNKITYTSVGGTNSKMFNLQTNLNEPITTHYDAFPIAPGDLYVHPYVGSNPGYSFFKMGGGADAQPIWEDTDEFGVYQAIGLLPQTTGADNRYVRISAGWSAGIFQDYQITKKADGQYNFRKIHEGPVQVCLNLDTGGLDTQIPVLARNGEMIAGRDWNDQMTKIYRILEVQKTDDPSIPRKADCELVQTIPAETSKISFSFDNKKVMFTLSDSNTGKGRLFEMDLETGLLTTLSLPSEDVMYMTYRYDSTAPTFNNDSMLLYSRRTEIPGPQSDLVLIKPNSVATVEHEQATQFEAIGHLWGKACSQELDNDYARAVGSRLNVSMCDELITAAGIGSLPEEYKDLNLEQLQGLCKTEARATKR